MPSIKSLRAFVLTMEQGSLTLASQTMNLSQPAASRLLRPFPSPIEFLVRDDRRTETLRAPVTRETKGENEGKSLRRIYT